MILNDEDELFEDQFDSHSREESFASDAEDEAPKTKPAKRVMKSSSNLLGSNNQSAEIDFLKQIDSDIEEDSSAPSSQLNALALDRSNSSRLPTQMPTVGPTLQATSNFESLGGFHEPNLSLDDTAGGNAADVSFLDLP
jgi:hypothetical protein